MQSMYSFEERLRAAKLYIKLGKRPKAVICQLGYPTKDSLKAWHEVFKNGGDLHASYAARRSRSRVVRSTVATTRA